MKEYHNDQQFEHTVFYSAITFKLPKYFFDIGYPVQTCSKTS